MMGEILQVKLQIKVIYDFQNDTQKSFLMDKTW